MNESDLRVKRTRRALKEAFVALVLAEDYETITVRQVVERAGVGHKTFYRHYPDKRALAIAIVEDILQEVRSVHVDPDSIATLEENPIRLLQVIDKHSDYLRRIRDVITLPEASRQMLSIGKRRSNSFSAFKKRLVGRSIKPQSVCWDIILFCRWPTYRIGGLSMINHFRLNKWPSISISWLYVRSGRGVETRG